MLVSSASTARAHDNLLTVLPQDVVYYVAPTQNVTVTVSLCGSRTFADAFDTKCAHGAPLARCKSMDCA